MVVAGIFAKFVYFDQIRTFIILDRVFFSFLCRCRRLHRCCRRRRHRFVRLVLDARSAARQITSKQQKCSAVWNEQNLSQSTENSCNCKMYFDGGGSKRARERERKGGVSSKHQAEPERE